MKPYETRIATTPEEWVCFGCGLKFYYTEPRILMGKKYCPDCIAKALTQK